MSYRRSTYDPLAVTHATRPMRPFNWVQRIGVGFEVAAIAWFLLFVATKLGWLPPAWIFEYQPAPGLALAGLLLINSRREEGDPITEAQRRRNAHWLWWSIAIAVGVAAIILVVSGGR